MRKILAIIFACFWAPVLAEYSLMLEWRNTEYETVKDFITHTYSRCVLACMNEQSCAIPGIRRMNDGGKTCHLLKGNPIKGKRNVLGVKKEETDGVLITEIEKGTIMESQFKITKTSVSSSWSSWKTTSPCNATCNGGILMKTRYCNCPKPSNGEEQCKLTNGTRGLVEVQEEGCNAYKCPVDGVWSRWGAYEPCSSTCGHGISYRYRSCSNPYPKHGGKTCKGDHFESKDCISTQCPVNGVWGAWSAYGACSKTCGPGTQSRTRKCDSPSPAYGGKVCEGSYTEEKTCEIKSCAKSNIWCSGNAWWCS